MKAVMIDGRMVRGEAFVYSPELDLSRLRDLVD